MRIKIITMGGGYFLKANGNLLGFNNLGEAIKTAQDILLSIHYLTMSGYTNAGIVLSA